jgi:hypothetical protein
MSAANAAAIRRRANNQPTTPTPSNTPTNNTNAIPQTAPANNNQPGLTLKQVINNLDNRISSLETKTPDINGIDTVFSPTVMEEFNARFEILANELADIKDTIMKLQTFTMEVNKSMHDERIHILSEVGSTATVNNIKDISDEASATSASIKDMAQNELSNTN